ncbi:alpha/beta hydrolase [Amycolatopsis benzoatilytica]|uniref:alpha/beta hydrolase n=1 Tax=Amycolatopsis benzoatilytica TaxID=346045 RepID=UPI0003754C02|nr:alpha/beta hydrolase [Amycolatopsis benzoatilytica]
MSLSSAPPTTSRFHRSSRAARRAALILVVAGAVAVALLVLGAVFPAVPGLGTVGSLVVDPRALWFVLSGAVLLVGAVLLRRRARTAAVWITVSAIAALGGSGTALAGQLAFAASEHVALDAADLFDTRGPAAPPDQTLTYARIGGQELRAGVWLPRHATGGPRPAVMWIHGGGFTAGSFTEQDRLYRYLADQGYPVISVDYRLAPQPLWQGATGDIVCALSWIETHAADYDIDPGQIVLSGGSAGGSLALNASYGLAAHSVASSCGGTPAQRPVAVAAFFPPSDIAAIYTSNGLFGYGRSAALTYTGGTPAQYPDRYAYASASSKVRPGLMPTLLVTGMNDHLIPEPTVRALAGQLTTAGNLVTYHAVPYSDHAFDADFHSIGATISRTLLLRFLADATPLGTRP